MPSPERLQRWITAEVVPSIRKTGRYVVAEESREVRLAQGLLLPRR